MECLTLYQLHVRVIKIITDQGITQIFHMNSYLMGAAGFQNQGDQAVPVFYIQNLVMGNGGFAFFEIHGTLDDGTFFAGQGRRNGAFLRSDRAFYNGKVFSGDAGNSLVGNHCGEHSTADVVLGNQSKTGGITVQTIDAAEDERAVLPLKIAGKSVSERIIVIVHGRMDWHSGRLVNHHQIFILINNIQRQIHRRNFFGGMLFKNVDGQYFSRLQHMIHETGHSVCQYGSRILF